MKKQIRIISLIALATFVVIALINTFLVYPVQKNINEEKLTNSNIYLNEEVCFAKEVYVKVDGIFVEKNEETYLLHLHTFVEQRSSDGKLDKIKLSPSDFVLKSVNLKAKNRMSIFFEALFKASLSALISGAIEGEINIIEETISFIGDYTTDSIDNAIDAKTKFKNIKANKTFAPFYPRDNKNGVALDLVFPIKINWLEQTDNIIVLTIDQWNHVERRIFLTTRPY